MFYCYECQKFMERVKVSHELMGEWCGQPAYQDYWQCPNCGSLDIEEDVRKCLCCGGPAIGKEWYCEDCHDKAKLLIRQAVQPFVCDGADKADAADLLLEELEKI